jgi:hypothetical protein
MAVLVQALTLLVELAVQVVLVVVLVVAQVLVLVHHLQFKVLQGVRAPQVITVVAAAVLVLLVVMDKPLVLDNLVLVVAMVLP